LPVIAKEVGWGISENTARRLFICGVSAIDVAGAGGTSWSQVEMHRAPDDFTRQLASGYNEWGITTADSIKNVKRVAPELLVFASGGITNGLEIAKSIALGAELGGMASPFLKAASTSTEHTIKLIKLVDAQIQTTMFSAGVKTISDLQNVKLCNS